MSGPFWESGRSVIFFPLDFTAGAEIQREQIQISPRADADEWQERYSSRLLPLVLEKTNRVAMQITRSAFWIGFDVGHTGNTGGYKVSCTIVARERCRK